jgi:hypothetical protein
METAITAAPVPDTVWDTSARGLAAEERRQRAALHILAAYNQDEAGLVHTRSTKAARNTAIFLRRFNVIKWLAIWFLIALSLLERPAWCYRDTFKYKTSGYACETKQYPGWGHTYMDLNVAFMYESACLFVLLCFEVGHTYAGTIHRC